MPDDNTIFGSGVFLHVGGRVLLQKRTHDAPTYPNQWGSFGGHSEPGEAPEAAAIREIKEELGLIINRSDLSPVTIIPVIEGYATLDIHYFSCPLSVSLRDIRLDEGSGFALFARDELDDLKLVSNTKAALEHFFDS